MSKIWIILIVVIGVLLVLCICGLILSLKRAKHDKKLQKSSDYSFKTNKGNYSFLYLIKGFKVENGKLIKIATHPYLGFSDIAYSSTNGCNYIRIVCKDRKTGEEIEVNDDKNTAQSEIQMNSEILIPSNLLDQEGLADLEVKIESSWTLGGDSITDELTFDFKK